jgi:hypothetical protein
MKLWAGFDDGAIGDCRSRYRWEGTAQDPYATATSIQNGWFQTLARCDAGGYYWFRGPMRFGEKWWWLTLCCGKGRCWTSRI